MIDLFLPGSAPSSVASKYGLGFLGSDPNSGQSFRSGQQGFLGSDHNFAAKRSGAPAGTAEGSANLGSDPNDPGSLYPFAPSAMASKCVVAFDRDVFVFIFGPTHT